MADVELHLSAVTCTRNEHCALFTSIFHTHNVVEGSCLNDFLWYRYCILNLNFLVFGSSSPFNWEFQSQY